METQIERHHVLISRALGSKEIKINVTTEAEGTGIEILMSLEDFVSAVCVEAKSPALLITKTQFKNRLQASVATVIEKMKKETAKVV